MYTIIAIDSTFVKKKAPVQNGVFFFDGFFSFYHGTDVEFFGCGAATM